MTNEFDKGREFERLKENMRWYLWLGYGSIIYLVIFVLAELSNHSINNIYTIIALFLFGNANLYLGYSAKKELKEYETNKNK